MNGQSEQYILCSKDKLCEIDKLEGINTEDPNVGNMRCTTLAYSWKTSWKRETLHIRIFYYTINIIEGTHLYLPAADKQYAAQISLHICTQYIPIKQLFAKSVLHKCPTSYLQEDNTNA